MKPHEWKEIHRNLIFIKYECKRCGSVIETTIENHIITDYIKDCDLEIVKSVDES